MAAPIPRLRACERTPIPETSETPSRGGVAAATASGSPSRQPNKHVPPPARPALAQPGAPRPRPVASRAPAVDLLLGRIGLVARAEGAPADCDVGPHVD